MHSEHEERVHTHEHTHADGTVHTHEHHHHADGHGHSHNSHDHACENRTSCEQNCESCEHSNITPREELMALMKYMVGHNASHANELAKLAGQLKELGEDTAYEQIMQAVSDFEKGNLRLSAVLAAMKG